ncbi:protein of unknown function [Stenotrophomonas maltophilia]|nr:protein of unknown function [Stenotrophomonas maltophilia]
MPGCRVRIAGIARVNMSRERSLEIHDNTTNFSHLLYLPMD